MIRCLPLLLVILCHDCLKIYDFSYAVLKSFCFQLEACDILSGLSNVVSLVKNNDRVIPCNLKVFPNLLVNQIVVRHKNDIGSASSIFYSVVRAKHMKLSLFVEVLNVEGIPRHFILAFVSIFEVNAGVDSFLQWATGSVQSWPLVRVYQLVDAEMISGA